MDRDRRRRRRGGGVTIEDLRAINGGCNKWVSPLVNAYDMYECSKTLYTAYPEGVLCMCIHEGGVLLLLVVVLLLLRICMS